MNEKVITKESFIEQIVDVCVEYVQYANKTIEYTCSDGQVINLLLEKRNLPHLLGILPSLREPGNIYKMGYKNLKLNSTRLIDGIIANKEKHRIFSRLPEQILKSTDAYGKLLVLQDLNDILLDPKNILFVRPDVSYIQEQTNTSNYSEVILYNPFRNIYIVFEVEKNGIYILKSIVNRGFKKKVYVNYHINSHCVFIDSIKVEKMSFVQFDKTDRLLLETYMKKLRQDNNISFTIDGEVNRVSEVVNLFNYTIEDNSQQ